MWLSGREIISGNGRGAAVGGEKLTSALPRLMRWNLRSLSQLFKQFHAKRRDDIDLLINRSPKLNYGTTRDLRKKPSPNAHLLWQKKKIQ